MLLRFWLLLEWMMQDLGTRMSDSRRFVIMREILKRFYLPFMTAAGNQSPSGVIVTSSGFWNKADLIRRHEWFQMKPFPATLWIWFWKGGMLLSSCARLLLLKLAARPAACSAARPAAVRKLIHGDESREPPPLRTHQADRCGSVVSHGLPHKSLSFSVRYRGLRGSAEVCFGLVVLYLYFIR